MVALAEKQNAPNQQRLARRRKAFTIHEIMDAVAEAHGVRATEYVGFPLGAAGHDVADLVHSDRTLEYFRYPSGKYAPDLPGGYENRIDSFLRNVEDGLY